MIDWIAFFFAGIAQLFALALASCAGSNAIRHNDGEANAQFIFALIVTVLAYAVFWRATGG